MSKAISKSEITDACIRAITIAEDSYSKWSGGMSMRAAPESLAQTFIADEIASLGVKIELEASASGFIKRANGNCKKPPRNKNGRVDIAVFWKSKLPRLIIEIKKYLKKSLQTKIISASPKY